MTALMIMVWEEKRSSIYWHNMELPYILLQKSKLLLSFVVKFHNSSTGVWYLEGTLYVMFYSLHFT